MSDRPKEESIDFMDDQGRVVLTPIGVIHSPLTDASEEIPFQSFDSDVEGAIEVFEGYEDGLEGIEGFSHIFVIFYMHKSQRTKLRTVPLMEDEERGVFGTRSPSRPNHLGASTLRLLSRDSRFLKVRGLDILDGTPVLDIKPYVPRVDLVRDANDEWLIKKLERLGKSDTAHRKKLRENL